MKRKIISAISVAALSACVSVTAFANQVTLLNTSPSDDGNTMTLTYRLVYKNVGEAPVFGAPETIHLAHDKVIHFSMNGYQLAGIVPTSIENHVLPPEANEFDKPQQCSLATSKDQPNGVIAITLVKNPNGHGSVSCITQGGIIQ